MEHIYDVRYTTHMYHPHLIASICVHGRLSRPSLVLIDVAIGDVRGLLLSDGVAGGRGHARRGGVHHPGLWLHVLHRRLLLLLHRILLRLYGVCTRRGLLHIHSALALHGVLLLLVHLRSTPTSSISEYQRLRGAASRITIVGTAHHLNVRHGHIDGLSDDNALGYHTHAVVNDWWRSDLGDCFINLIHQRL
jgi:hypothetical protein